MKKSIPFTCILPIILAFAVVLVSCSSSTAVNNSNKDGGSEKKVSLSMSFWGGDADVKTYEERAALVTQKYPNIKLEATGLPNDGYDAKLQTMIASGSTPDIVQIAESSNSYASKGIFTDVGTLAEAAGIDLGKRFGTATASYTWKEKLYAIPDRSGAMVLYYNRDMFDAAGLDYPTKDWTWNEFLNAAKKLTITDSSGIVTQYGYAGGGWWPWWMSFMYQNGGRILDESMENVVINSPANIEAINFYNDLVHKHKVAPSADDYSRFGLKDGQPDPLFAQGNCAMVLTGFWNIASLSSVEDLNWDISPVWKQKEGATFSFGSGLAIPTNSKNVDAAFKAIDFLTSVEGQTPIVTNNQDAPANIELLKSDLFLKPSWAQEKNINFGAFADSADIITSPPLHPKWNEIQRVFDENFSVLFQTGDECTETIQKIEKDLQAVIE